MTLTPEQLAKSREEFERLIYTEKHHLYRDLEKDEDGNYFNPVLSAMFEGFILRQESLLVEIPKTQEHKKKDQLALTNIKSGFNVCIGEIKHSLQSAGINYRDKE